MNLSNLLKDPIDIPLLFIYVVGVLIMVYSAMQFVHGFLYKKKPYIRSGVKTFIIAVVLLAPRLLYQHIRIDGSDYLKEVRSSLKSVSTVFDTEGAADSSNMQSQLEALSERLSDAGYSVELTSSVGNDKDGSFTVRNLSASKSASDADSDIILISTSLDSEGTEADFTDDAANISVLESVAKKSQKTNTAAEIRFLVLTDGRGGQDGAYTYIDSLTESEKERLIGNISFDLTGLSDYTGFETSTSNGVDNPLSVIIGSSLKRMTGQKANIMQNKESLDTAFHVKGVSGVLLKQAYVEKADAAKALDKLNEDEIADAAAIISDAVNELIRSQNSGAAASLRSLSSDEKVRYSSGSFRKDRDSFMCGASLKEISENFGTPLKATGITDAYGNETYEGHLYLLTFDSPVPVIFHVSASGLERVTIDTGSISSTKDELTQILKNLFGEPEDASGIILWKDEKANASYCIGDSGSPDAVSSMTTGGYSFYITSN